MSAAPKELRCAVYTRKSSDEGLDQEFNSLDAQREASEAYVKSQTHEGWRLLGARYDDGGFSGGTMERPGLRRLLADIAVGAIDTVVVYKIDRLTRSLADFARIVELFDKHGVSFVSVTQSFNTTSSMGRLTLNVLLSFAQFEREVTGERIRDKIAASKAKGMWMGGDTPARLRPANRQVAGAGPEPRRGRDRSPDLPPVSEAWDRARTRTLAGRAGHRVQALAISPPARWWAGCPSAAARSTISSATRSIWA